MLVAGAKGFASEIIDTVLESVIAADLFFYDDVSPAGENLKFGRFKIIKSEQEAKEFFHARDNRFTVGVGNPHLRKLFAEKLLALGGDFTTVISRRTSVGKFENKIGDGCIILQRAIVEASNIIQQGTLIHAGAFISHNVSIGEYCEISPYSKLLGNVSIGHLTSIGTGAVILPGIKVGTNCVVGAGAVVTKDVPDNTVVAGVPALVLQRND